MTANGIVCETMSIPGGGQVTLARKNGFYTLDELKEIEAIKDAELVEEKPEVIEVPEVPEIKAEDAPETNKPVEADTYINMNKDELKAILTAKEIKFGSRETRDALLKKAIEVG